MTACPTPAKKPYPSRRAARAAARLLHQRRKAGPGRVHPYLCPCRSHWHVGH